MATPLNVLFVEDSENDVLPMVHALRRGGFDLAHEQVATAGAMQAALNRRSWDVVIAACALSQFSGLSALELVKQVKPDLPFILVSGDAAEDLAVKAMRLGAHDYITKDNLARLVPVVQRELKEAGCRHSRQHMQDALLWEAGVNAAIAELSSALISSDSIEDISQMILENAQALTQSEAGYIGYIDLETGALVCPAMSAKGCDVRRVDDKDLVFDKFTGLWGWVLEHKKPLMTNSPQDAPYPPGTPPGHIPIHRFLSVPAMIDGQLVGQISLANAARDYTDRDVELLQRFASLYAVALRRNWVEEALRASEAKLCAIFNSTQAAFVLLDREGRVQTFNNKAAEQVQTIYGRPLIEGAPVLDYISPSGQEAFRAHFQRALDGETVDVDRSSPVSNGDVRWYHYNYNPVMAADGRATGVSLSILDITAQKRAEEALRDRTNELDLLYKAGRELSSTLDEQTIYGALFRIISDIMDCSSLFVSSYSRDDNLIRCEAAWRADGPPYDVSDFPPIPLEAEGRGTQSQVIRSGQPLYLADYQTAVRTARTRYYVDEDGAMVDVEDVPEEEGVPRSALIVPLKLQDDVVGVIQVFSHRRDAYTPEDLKMLEALASQAAAAKANAALYKQAQNELAERNRAERALAKEHTLLRTLIDNIPDFIYAKDAESRFTLNNAAHLLALGANAPAETIGKTDFDYFPPELAERYYADEQQIIATGQPLLKHEEMVASDWTGGKRWVLTTKVPLRDEQGEVVGLVGIGYDITARKRMEEALRASERKFRSVIEQSTDGIVLVDESEVIVEWNRAQETITGLAREEALGKALQDVLFRTVPPVHRTQEMYEKLKAKLAESGQPDEPGWKGHLPAVEICRPDGERRTVQLTLYPVETEQGYMMVAISRDVTESNRLERALRETNQTLEAIIEGAPLAIMLLDPEMRVRIWNPAAEWLFGWWAEEVINRPYPILPDTQRVDFEDILKATAKGGVIGGLEMRPCTSANDLVDVAYSVSALSGEQGHAEGYLVIMEDVTERKQVEEALRERELLRIELEKEREVNELKSRFVTMVSHEFRTPLATILLTNNTLENHWEKMDEAQRRGRFAKIKAQVDHMTALLEDVLTIGRLDSDRVEFNPYPLDLYRFFGEIVGEFRSAHSSTHQVTLSKNGSESCAAFNGDGKLLRQVLTNLLSNAIKYSPAGSTIQVVLTCEDEQDVVLSVADQGIGIGEDDLQQLFEPFRRGDNVGNVKGTGLGLAIAKRAVECHGGAITCTSTIDQGSTFTVRLPQTQPQGDRNE